MIKKLSLSAGLALTLTALAASAGSGVESVTSAALTATGKPALTEQVPVTEAYPGIVPNATTNYTFATGTTGSLADMSTGTTQLLAANLDDTASPLTDIGFDFFFQGARFTQFSINENGVLRLGAAAQAGSPYQPLAQTNIPLITAYGADQRTHLGDGKVHFRVTGTAPSRTLTVEWLNNQSNFNSGGTADLTYQVQLHETTGSIGFVYGSMTMSTAGATSTDSQDPQIGFSSTNTAGNVGSVDAPLTGTPAPSYNGASATPVNNLYNAAGPITVLTSAANGARRTFDFTPPVPTAPTALNFSGVTALSTTLNWTDSPDELSYVVYNSTDGVNFTFAGTAAQNAVTATFNGLTPSTNYTWRVFAVSEGALSTALSGTQATPAPGNVSSVAGGGNWSNPATWGGGAVPNAADNVTIVAGSPVVIDTAAVALSLTVNSSATLQWDPTAARTLVVGTSVLNNGIFEAPATGTVTTHVLTVGTSLTNNNTLDFSTNGNTAGAGIVFTGAANSTFGGSGATTDVRAVTVNKGTNSTPTLELNPASFTVQGVATDSAGFLTLSNGTFKLSGSFTATNRVFTTAGYSIGATTGFWLNNPNFVVAGQNGSATVAGRLRVTTGIYNVGTATGNSIGFSAGSNINIEGGSVNAAGRFGVGASATAFTYTQSNGTITVCTFGNTSTTLGCFDLGTSAAATVAISGGTIVSQLASTAASGPRDYRHQAGTGAASITGGTLQMGNASSGAAKIFTIAGATPNLVVTNTSANHTVNFAAPSGINNVSRNITINAGAILNTGNQVFLFNGSNITNNGTLTSTGASARFITFLVGTPITYQGSGTVTAPMNSLELQNDLAFTFDPAVSNVVTNRVIIFSGSFVNANKLTLGSGGTSTGIVQIGNTTTPTGGGTFDVAPVFNLGSGGQTISYLRTVNSKTTGPEINPARALTNLSYDDDNVAHSLTLAGGDLTVAATLALTNGPVVTGSDTILVGGTGSVTRTTGYVDGYLGKTYTAAGSKTFEVGTSTGYSPVTANATVGTFPLAVEATALTGKLPNFAPADKTIDRYWRVLAPAGTTADLGFTYVDGDVPGTVTEANLHVYNGTPSPPTVYTDLVGTIAPATNLGSVSGVTGYEYFGLAEAGGGTSADLAISKTDGVTTVDTGGSLTYTITVTNPGSIAVNAANVVESPGPDLTCGAWTCSASAGSSCGAASGVGVINDAPSVLPGGTVAYSQSCTVATVSVATNVSNSVVVNLPSGLIDATPSNNVATDIDDLVRLSNLSITKTDGTGTVNAGSSVIYTITVNNAGPNAASTTTTDTFPTELTGCTWTCAATGGSCAASGAGSFADSGSLSSGGSLVYTATCTVSPAASGTLANTASVAVGAGERDTDPSNNSATDTDTVIQLPDVAVTITDNRQFVRVGDSLNYVIRVSNPAGSATVTAAVSDVLPSELSGGAWTCSGTGGATCASGTGNTLSDNAVLPGGSEAAYVYSATVQPGSPDGIITNTATVTAAGDPNPANNSATDTPQDIIVIFKNGFETAPITLVPDGVGNENGFVGGLLRVDSALLGSLDLAPVAVATGYSDTGAELFTLELARFNQQVMLRSVLRDANGLAERSAWIAIDPARHGIEFAWQAASGDAQDGYLHLAGGNTSQTSGNRAERGKLATLAVTAQQNLPWLSLVTNAN